MSDKTDKAASKTATKKPAKRAASKKAPAKKTAAKKSAAKEPGEADDPDMPPTPAAKKPAAKKPGAKKATAKKTAAKKTAAKKTEAKKPKPAAPAAKKAGAAKKGKAKASVDCTGKSLVIVESPAKAKTINKYLGDAYVVKASMGHIRDLPPRDLGVSIDKKFAPTYDILADKKKIVTELRKLAKDAERIFYACDPDREGEAIAWHLSEILKSNKPSARVTFNEITKAAIERAFESPGQIDMNKVSAQQARRILDRIVGYKISPLLWNKVKPNLSAGRVQSVAVKLIAEREAQIRAFEAKEYWRLTAEFRQQDGAAESAKFFADLNNLGGATLDPKGFCIENQARAKLVQARLAAGQARVSRCDVKERKDDPFPPFITSTLQQAASTKLRFSTKKTMFLAQELYEGVDLGGEVGLVGLITYMRTDSFNLAQEAIDAGRAYIKAHFGEDYVPEKPRFYKTKKKSAQEAHEAIRPTNPELSPSKVKPHLSPDQHKLYQLIWNRFIGCQMTSAKYAHKTVEVTLTPDPAAPSAAAIPPDNGAEAAAPDARYDGPGTFRIVGKSVIFDGHAKVTGLKLKPQEPILPEFKVDDPIDLLKLQESQHFTQPPPRYTEASLVKTLEEYGIGRPSTYSAITQTIQDRGYVRQENRRLYATRLGEIVTEKLDEHFSDILNTDFTSQMEAKLDQVEEAQEDWVKLLDNFYQPFEKDLAEANAKMKGINEDPKKSDLKCEKCGTDMFYMYNRRDLSRFLGCGQYPKCKTTLPVDEEDKPQIPEETKEQCTKCGSSMVIRQGKNGPFIACSAYPQCDNTKEIDSEGKTSATPELAEPVHCEECGKEMKLKRSRYGHFLGCSGYPKCRVTLRVTIQDGKAVPEEKVEDEETPKIDVKCEKCGAPMSLRRSRRGPFLGCSRYPKCRSIADVPEGVKLPAPPKPKEIGEDCPECGKALIERRGRRGPFIACSGYPKCKFTRPVKGESS